MPGHYTRARLENIPTIMTTYAQFLRPNDEVYLGISDDSEFPYRGMERPYGNVHSIIGPPGNQMINVQLDAKFGGKMAHCDVRSLNPYLVLEPKGDTYRNAQSRAAQDPATQALVRQEIAGQETMFRRPFQEESGGDALTLRGAQETQELREELSEVKDTVFRAVHGLAEDIRGLGGEATYAGRMLNYMEPESQLPELEFRGIDNSDASDAEE